LRCWREIWSQFFKIFKFQLFSNVFVSKSTRNMLSFDANVIIILYTYTSDSDIKKKIWYRWCQIWNHLEEKNTNVLLVWCVCVCAKIKSYLFILYSFSKDFLKMCHQDSDIKNTNFFLFSFFTYIFQYFLKCFWHTKIIFLHIS